MYNIYCDESCHLENDGQKSMVLGAVWAPVNKVKTITNDINAIKVKYGLTKFTELKWTKISPSKINMYEDIVNYFFDNRNLHFRCVVIPDKSKLNHSVFNQTHDDWYYKMYFNMLKSIIIPTEEYNIYLDIKDTQSANKVRGLHTYLGNTIYDFKLEKIKKVQSIRSHESILIQICDILMGAVSYNSRELNSSDAKIHIMELIKSKSGYNWKRNTLYREDKFNMLIWNGQRV